MIVMHDALQGPVFLRVQGYPLERHEARAMSFTEEYAHWQLPMNEVNIICDIITDNGRPEDQRVFSLVESRLLRDCFSYKGAAFL